MIEGYAVFGQDLSGDCVYLARTGHWIPYKGNAFFVHTLSSIQTFGSVENWSIQPAEVYTATFDEDSGALNLSEKLDFFSAMTLMSWR